MKTSKKVKNKTNSYFCNRGGCFVDIMILRKICLRNVQSCARLSQSQSWIETGSATGRASGRKNYATDCHKTRENQTMPRHLPCWDLVESRRARQTIIKLAALNIATLTNKSREIADTMVTHNICLQETRWEEKGLEERQDTLTMASSCTTVAG